MKSKKVTAAGGVVYRKAETSELQVLLIYRNGVWDLPKGKLEKGESIEECAAREVMEEVGSDELPVIKRELMRTEHSYIQKGKQFDKTTHWFAMQFNKEQMFTPQENEGIEQVEWEMLGTAISKVGYENLVSVLKSFSNKT